MLARDIYKRIQMVESRADQKFVAPIKQVILFSFKFVRSCPDMMKPSIPEGLQTTFPVLR